MTDVILPGALTLDKISEIENSQATPKGAYHRELGSFANSAEPFRIVMHRDFKGKKGTALKQSFSQNLLPHKRAESWPEISVLVTTGKALGMEDPAQADADFVVLVNEDLRAELNATEASDEDKD
jgi:hypothetical protein